MPVLSLISRETDSNGFFRTEKYVSEKGTEYSIEPTEQGLYRVVMHGGGKPPAVCDSSYTSGVVAKQTLIRYLETTDRLGYAEWPGKDPAKAKKGFRHGAEADKD